MVPLRVVFDTNVIIAAMRSRRGASFRILSLLGDPRFEFAISSTLLLEYEAVAFRAEPGIPLAPEAIIRILDRMCDLGRRPGIFFRLRPQLRDPGDEFVLELAVAGGCTYIVTHNRSDFIGAEQFGVRAISPAAFLRLIGEAHVHDQPDPS
jgi:putative PIN family toxin of toxin-antitoxin system